jgi:hypothetical protein
MIAPDASLGKALAGLEISACDSLPRSRIR